MVKKKNKSKGSRLSKVVTNANTSGGSDISNRTVMIVLIVVILVSVVSMVTYMQALDNAKPKVLVNGGVAKGEVSLTLLPPNDSSAESADVSGVSSKGGQVSLTLLADK